MTIKFCLDCKHLSDEATEEPCRSCKWIHALHGRDNHEKVEERKEDHEDNDKFEV